MSGPSPSEGAPYVQYFASLVVRRPETDDRDDRRSGGDDPAVREIAVTWV
jgi:hypothetical protein